MAKDYTEYQYTDFEKHMLRLRDTKDITFRVFRNTATFYPETKTVRLTVDDGFEDIMRLDEIEEYNRLQCQHQEVHEDTIDTEEEAMSEQQRVEGLKQNEEDFRNLCGKFNIDRTQFETNVRNEYVAHPNTQEQPLNNVLSGSDITLRYGEGLLDFVYADFEDAFKDAARSYSNMVGLVEALASLQGMDVEAARAEAQKRSEPVEKVYSHVCDIVDELFQFDCSVSYVDRIMYRSLYTAICPPSITHDSRVRPALDRYYDYIRFLQEEYKELIEFCFDPDFWPEVLGSLHAVERYILHQRIKGFPLAMQRTERFDFDVHHMSGSEVPYGLSKDELLARFSGSIQTTPALTMFAEKYGVKEDDLKMYIRLPQFLNVRYEFRSVADILQLEFSKLLEANMRFRKVPQSGQYELPTDEQH